MQRKIQPKLIRSLVQYIFYAMVQNHSVPYPSYQSRDKAITDNDWSLHLHQHNRTTNQQDAAPSTSQYGKPKTRTQMALVIISAVAFLGMVLFLWSTGPNSNNSTVSWKDTNNADASLVWYWSSKTKKNTMYHEEQYTVLDGNNNNNEVAMPYGVNLGSWLSLEDYFYVGDSGAVEVATPDDNTAAICLPPLHLGQAGAPAWHSETDLLTRYVQTFRQ